MSKKCNKEFEKLKKVGKNLKGKGPFGRSRRKREGDGIIIDLR
jgi:hypothetical protein